MARSRPYSVQFNGVSVAALQDLIAVYCGAAMAVELHGVTLGQITGTTVQNLRISVKRLASAVTSGSGGGVATPQKILRGDATPTATARINDTVQSTSAGVAVVHSDVFNTVNGFQLFWPPADMPTAGPGEAFSVTLDAAPASALVMSGTLYFAELF